jgi:hypothetical protein
MKSFTAGLLWLGDPLISDQRWHLQRTYRRPLATPTGATQNSPDLREVVLDRELVLDQLGDPL